MTWVELHNLRTPWKKKKEIKLSIRFPKKIKLIVSHYLPTHFLSLSADSRQIFKGGWGALQNNYALTNLMQISCWEVSLANASTQHEALQSHSLSTAWQQPTARHVPRYHRRYKGCAKDVAGRKGALASSRVLCRGQQTTNEIRLH